MTSYLRYRPCTVPVLSLRLPVQLLYHYPLCNAYLRIYTFYYTRYYIHSDCKVYILKVYKRYIKSTWTFTWTFSLGHFEFKSTPPPINPIHPINSAQLFDTPIHFCHGPVNTFTCNPALPSPQEKKGDHPVAADSNKQGVHHLSLCSAVGSGQATQTLPDTAIQLRLFETALLKRKR